MQVRDFRLERLARSLLLFVCCALTLLFAVQFVADLLVSGPIGGDLAITANATKALASTVSRAFNNLMTMVLAFIALAVPITANMYTPRLIEIFVRDRVNLVVLLFYALMGANAVFVQALGLDQWAPRVMYLVLAVSGVIGFAILIPYYLYVLSFLDPDRIIERVTERIIREYQGIARGVRPIGELQHRLHERIHHLGNVILRSVDRADRDVALSAIEALRRAVEAYAEPKRTAPAAWFDVRRDIYVGLSKEAIDIAVRERVWVERRCLSQLLLAYESSLTRMTDAISAISQTNRKIAVHAAREGDAALVRLCVRFFNTYLRSALRRKDMHAVNDVLYQYRLFAQQVLAHDAPAAVEVARHFRYYAEFARFQGMSFVYELVCYELGQVVESAFDSASPSSAALLEAFLAFETGGANQRLVTGQAVLAGWFEGRSGFVDERAKLRAALGHAPRSLLERARQAIASTDDPAFWEITDRQVNLDYLEPARRARTVALLDACLSGPAGGSAG